MVGASRKPESYEESPVVTTDLGQAQASEPILRTKGLLGLVVMALLVVVLAGIRAASDLVAQTLLGIVLAVAVTPVTDIARRWRWPTWAGALLASMVLLLFTLAFGVLLGLAGSQLAQELRRFRTSFATGQRNLRSALIEYELEVLMPLFEGSVDLSRMDVLPRVLDAAMSLGSFGFVMFVALFTLFEGPTFETKWYRITRSDPKARANVSRVLWDVQRYLLIKSGTCMLTGLFVGLWTAAVGLEGAVLWGILAFALNYIPFLGSLLAGIPPTVIALVGLDLLTGISVGVGILLINFAIGNILEPRIMGRTMGLSPLVVLLSVAIWGWVLGPVGALLSVPLTVIVKLAIERSDRYAWVAVLLESPVNIQAYEERRAARAQAGDLMSGPSRPAALANPSSAEPDFVSPSAAPSQTGPDTPKDSTNDG